MSEFNVRTVSEPKKEQSKWTSVAFLIGIVGVAGSIWAMYLYA